MRLLVIILFVFSFSSLAGGENKVWKKCHKDSDCKMNKKRACGLFCYNKNYEKEAFEWESHIVWECIAPRAQEYLSRCVDGECSCEEKK